MSYRHISGWVNVTGPEGPEGPVDPGWGRPGGPIDPGWGQRPPVDPGYGRPDWGGGGIDNTLPGAPGHIWGALIRWILRPQVGGGPSGKPPGRPVVPVDPGYNPPQGPPSGGGGWEPIDPGFGKPPLWGWVGIDNGLPPGPSTKPPDGGSQPPGGAWVPTDPDFGKPVRPCPPVGGKPHPPIWAWIPDRPSFPKPTPEPGTTTLNPATATVLASGGSGSVNVTVTPSGTWTVDPLSVPPWVTLTSMGPQPSDANMVYSAAQNTTGAPRQAFIKVNNATFTLNQGAV